MQICEYYRQESHENMEFFEGRWHWEIQNEQIDTDSCLTTFVWTDLFRKEEKITFTSKKPNFHVYFLSPLSTKFGLIGVYQSGDGFHQHLVIEFDWERKEFHIGEKGVKYSEYHVLPDRNCLPNGDFNVVFCNRDELYQPCRVDVKNLQVFTTGPAFELREEEFYHIELFGDNVTGISDSLDAILRYNLTTHQFLDRIKICELSPEIGWPMAPRYQKVDDRWTFCNQFFVSMPQTKIENGQEVKYIALQCIDLETGKTETIGDNFQHEITKICQNLEDGHLYLRTREEVGYGYRNESGEFVEYTADTRRSVLMKYHCYRIPLNEPESLFFTAFKNVPKPLPEIVEKLALMRKNLPLHIYN